MQKKSSPALIIILIAAFCVLGYAGWHLYGILKSYKDASDLYKSARESFVTPNPEPATGIDPKGMPDGIEDAVPPVLVNWDDLKAKNKDIIGWIYVEARPSISYPIVWKDKDNDYYLHRSYEGDYLYAGAIFLEGLNQPDFSDPVSILYGHNMKDGSMFARIKELSSQEEYDKAPYFWVLTPDGTYRYHIFSVLQTNPKSDVYHLFEKPDAEFFAWEKALQKSSFVKNDTPLYQDDHTVILSTCHSDHENRWVVVGRCCSSDRPEFNDKSIRATAE